MELAHLGGLPYIYVKLYSMGYKLHTIIYLCADGAGMFLHLFTWFAKSFSK